VIPLRSEQKRRRAAAVTLFLILINVAAFAYEIWLPSDQSAALIHEFGLVPARIEPAVERPSIDTPRVLLTLATSMFLHGGILHLAGNMLFLWVFGGSIEDHLGHARYLIFYLICGIAAGLVHVAFNWVSQVPSIGASGAISGLMGAYIVLFPWSRILTVVPVIFFFFRVRLPAFLMLAFWFAFQLASGLATRGQPGQGGVAWWAHIGGFVAGVLLVRTSRVR
jgi:membrane associated rhomboid family serine protease